MSEVIIAVRGESEERVAPERATIHVVVSAEGAERAAVVERAMRLAEPVRASITERQRSGEVAEWTSKNLMVRAQRPWNSQGKQLAHVYTAHIDFTATFVASSALSVWVSDISTRDGVQIGWVNWHLTAETRSRVEREVATSAVRVAVERAEAYASALDLQTLTALEIADVGLISNGQAAEPQMVRARAAALAADSAPAMEYEPEDIVVSATVEARFSAR